MARRRGNGGRSRGRGRGRGGHGTSREQSTSPPSDRQPISNRNPFLSPSPPPQRVPASPRGLQSRGRRSSRGPRSQTQPPRHHTYNTRSSQQELENKSLEPSQLDVTRVLRSGRSYSISSSPIKPSSRRATAPKLEQLHEEPPLWAGTPSDFLLEAAAQANRTCNFDLPDEWLREVVLAAQKWIVERTPGVDLDYTHLATRIVEEGVLSVLLYVTAELQGVPHPSHFLNPFSNCAEDHFLSANSALQGSYSPTQSSTDVRSPELFSPEEIHISAPTSVSTTSTVSNQLVSPTVHPPVQKMATSTIDQFLNGLAKVASSGNAEELRNWLPIEPPFAPIYAKVVQEMRTQYPPSTQTAIQAAINSETDELQKKTDKLLFSVKTSTGDEWSGFSSFVAQYLCFIRDVDPVNLLDTYDKLTDLMMKTNSALNTPDVGVIMLPTTVAYAQVFARLAIGLEKQPELIAHLVEAPTDEGGESMSLPERAGNTVRNGFIACLNESAQYPPNQPAKPFGRHAGIYKLANICLKIFFQCNKTKSAEQIFMNIGAKSPPIDIYPRSERVTYLYYLGRFFFSVNHFYRAQAVLQTAYDNCHPGARSQRRLILIYLVTSNLILGRFPSESLYQRPEAQGFRERFQPLCLAIRKGDLPTFRRLTDMNNEHAEWFLFHRIFLQIRSRCEVLVWRSLSRRVWLLVGDRGDRETKKPPFLELEDLVKAAKYLESRALNPISLTDGGPGNRHTNWVFMSQDPPKEARYIDPDFDGLESDEEFYDEEGVDEYNPFLLPGMVEVESIMSSLVSQGLVNGYVSSAKKFAVMGAAKKEAGEAGWPNVWQTIKQRCEASGQDIPGWKKGGGGFGGMVVNLSGARPVGS